MNRKRLLLFILGFPALLGLLSWQLPNGGGFWGSLLRAYALACVLAVGLWLLTRLLRRLLWRVSRRLAFSYFLIGIVPIPLVLILVMTTAYIASGFFMGHLLRDVVGGMAGDLRLVAQKHLEELQQGNWQTIETDERVTVAFYHQGVRFAGDSSLPRLWRSWWPTEDSEIFGHIENPTFMSVGEHPTLMSAVSDGKFGVVACYKGKISQELSERSGIWVELFAPDDPRRVKDIKITILNRQFSLKPLRREASHDELINFLHSNIPEPRWLDKPLLVWVEIWRPFFEITADMAGEAYLYANLSSSPRALYLNLTSPSAEIDALAYVVLITVAFLLFDLYVIAALMALLMILGLSRAVNRLTDATHAVQKGDFTSRIEVTRRDQIGALHSSFNDMSSHLLSLIDQAAHKEILEKDLSIARELQQSLLPDTLAAPAELLFSTHFEPSSAIGGDYYDLLPMDDNSLAVVMADASGHGISAGLRMAMVKSALLVLADQGEEPQEILRRLHLLLREDLQRANRRSFVTVTLALIDCLKGELQITNAGHPPTYLLRQGKVTEIVLPSLPLGTLSGSYPQTTIILEAGDVLVWLSDGLIEATDQDSNGFGYEQVVQVLHGLEGDPVKVRDQILMAVGEHTAGSPPDDDRTLVVMGYKTPGETLPEAGDVGEMDDDEAGDETT